MASAFDEFNKKYKKEIEGISKAQGVTTDVGRDMFISNVEQGGQYGGGGVMDMSGAKTDLASIRANLLQPQVQSDGDAQPYPTFRAPQSNIPTMDEAYSQASARLSPQIQSIKNTLISKIAKTRETLPQQLSQRGQALGGQRALAEQDISSQEALQMANIGLQGETAKQELAQGIIGQAEAKYQQAYQNAFNLWRAEVSDVAQAEQISYSRKRDALSDMRYEEEQAWSRNINNPQVQSQILSNKLKMIDVENAPRESALRLRQLEQNLAKGEIDLANARNQANAIDKEVNGISYDEFKAEQENFQNMMQTGADEQYFTYYESELERKGYTPFQIMAITGDIPEETEGTLGDVYTGYNLKLATEGAESAYRYILDNYAGIQNATSKDVAERMLDEAEAQMQIEQGIAEEQKAKEESWRRFLP